MAEISGWRIPSSTGALRLSSQLRVCAQAAQPRELSEQGLQAPVGQRLLLPGYRPYSGCRGAQNFITTSRAPRCPCCLTASVRCPLQHTPPHSTHSCTYSSAKLCPEPLPSPKGSLSGRRVGLTAEASEPQPVSSCPEHYTLPKLPQVLPRHMPCLAPRESWSDPLLDPAAHIAPAGGVRGLEPQAMGPVLLLAPCPSGPQSWPLTSSLLLGSRAGPHMLPLSRQQGSLAMACRRGPGVAGRPGHRAALPHWPPDSALPAQQGSAGLGWGLAGGSFGTAHSLPFLVVGASGCLRAMLCRSGLRARSVLKPSAAASFELPTPLWSLYMPPEETVSTA